MPPGITSRSASKASAFTISLACFWAVCVILGFDFKGEESGGWFQVVSYCSCLLLLGIAAVLVSRREVRFPNNSSQLKLLLLFLFLVFTAGTSFLQAVPFSNYRVIVAPYLLFALGFYLASSLSRRYGAFRTAHKLLPSIRMMFWISLIWTAVYSLVLESEDYVNARYRVLTVLLPIGLAYIFSGAALKTLSFLDKCGAILFLALLLLSRTRSYAILAALGLVLTCFALVRMGTPAATLAKRISVWLTIGAIVLIPLAATFSYLSGGQSISALWQDRFASVDQFGFDLTSATRLAEYHDQLSKLFESPQNAFLGLGLGGYFTYSGSYGELVASVLGRHWINPEAWVGIHSLYVYSIFSGGLVFGSIFLWILISGLFASYRLLRSNKIKKRGDIVAVSTIAVGYALIIAIGATAFPLGSRALAFAAGVLLALVTCLSSANPDADEIGSFR